MRPRTAVSGRHTGLLRRGRRGDIDGPPRPETCPGALSSMISVGLPAHCHADLSALDHANPVTATARLALVDLLRHAGDLRAVLPGDRLRPGARRRTSRRAPRRCSGANVNPTNDFTGPSVHNTASVNANNASARKVGHRCNSRRNPANSPAASTENPSCTLFNLTALGIDRSTPGRGALPWQIT
jgi:hypothetical protein